MKLNKKQQLSGAWIFRAVLSCAVASGLQAGLQAQTISTFKAGDGAWHLGTLATGNLDAHPDLEIIVPYRDTTGTWFLDAFKYTGQRLAGFPYLAGGDPLNVSPTIVDLDADGRDEILLTRVDSLIALRGNGSVLWSTTVNAGNYVPNGGFHTVTNGFYWSAGGAFISRLPSTAVFSSPVSPPVVADLAGNGKYEVITAWKIDPDPAGSDQDYNPHISRIYGSGEWGIVGETWSGSVITFDAKTGSRTFAYHLHHLVESGLAVGRANRTGPLNVYELNDSDSVVSFDKSKPFGLWGKGMLHKQFGKNQRLITGSYQFPVDIQAADVDGDGLDEILVPGLQSTSLVEASDTILDDDGSILWRHWLVHTNIPHTAGWRNSASLIPCNPDHDNHVDVLGWNQNYEISFRYWTGAELAPHKGWPKNFYPFFPTPPVVGDVDGDGEEDIVVGTYHPTLISANGALYVFALDGTLKLTKPAVGGIKHIPAIADVRAIGQPDVIYRTTLGQVIVQNLGGNSTNLLSWVTHRGNMRRDGNLGRSLYPPGTPLITSKKSGSNRASFAWTNTAQPAFYRIYRAEQPDGPFHLIATLASDAQSYSDTALKPGVLYFYELAADYVTNRVRSAPFTVLSLLNGNLLANSGFEECDNSHWDKWFTGSLGMTNMVASTNRAYQGNQSMRLIFQQQDSSGSVAQFCQYGIPDSTIYVTPGEYYSMGGFIANNGLSAPSEHWVMWGSAKTGYDTNTRPALPYPDYFSSSASLGTGTSGWIYLNRTFRLPPGFPNIEVLHKFTMSQPGSGSVFLDNLFFRHIPSPKSTTWTALVPFGANWRYSSASMPNSWADPEFDDSAWAVGRAKFGAGSGPTNITTQLPQLKPSYFFRNRFSLPPGHPEELLLSATCTDLTPLSVFINGVRINSQVDIVTLQGNEARHFDLTPFAHLLQPGENLLAIRVPNQWSSWDDVAFDASLKVVLAQNPSGRLSISYANPSAPTISAQAPAGIVWKLQSKDNNADWQTMQVWTNHTTEVQTWVDTGLNGQPPPSGVGCRLYRLVPF